MWEECEEWEEWEEKEVHKAFTPEFGDILLSVRPTIRTIPFCAEGTVKFPESGSEISSK